MVSADVFNFLSHLPRTALQHSSIAAYIWGCIDLVLCFLQAWIRNAIEGAGKQYKWLVDNNNEGSWGRSINELEWRHGEMNHAG